VGPTAQDAARSHPARRHWCWQPGAPLRRDCIPATGSDRARRSLPSLVSCAATASSTGRLVNTCTSVRNRLADSGALPVAPRTAGDSLAGVIWSRADARYSGGRSQVKPRLSTSAIVSVPRNTRRRRRFVCSAVDARKFGRTRSIFAEFYKTLDALTCAQPRAPVLARNRSWMRVSQPKAPGAGASGPLTW
jgi:hypothetical protein